MDYLLDLKNHHGIYLNFMKEKYPVFNKSNIFLRDMQYAIKSYFQKKDHDLTYAQTEKLAIDFTKYLEDLDVLYKISNNTWKLNYSFEIIVTNTDGQITS